MLTFSQQIFYALVYMSHPFLFFCARGCIHSKWFGCCSDKPSISIFYWKRKRCQIRNWSKLILIDANGGQIFGYLCTAKHYLRPVSSSPCSCTSSNGIMCCLLYFFLLITMLPYTSISLNRKNCLAFGRLRHIFVKTPSPTSTRPTIFSG